MFVVLDMGTYAHNNKQVIRQKQILVMLDVPVIWVHVHVCVSVYAIYIYTYTHNIYTNMSGVPSLNTLLLQGVPMTPEPAVSSKAGRRCASAVLASCAVGAVLAPEALILGSIRETP